MSEFENCELVSGDGEGKCTDVMFFDFKVAIRFSGEAVVVLVVVAVKMKSRVKRVSDILGF